VAFDLDSALERSFVHTIRNMILKFSRLSRIAATLRCSDREAVEGFYHVAEDPVGDSNERERNTSPVVETRLNVEMAL